jgi:hypothetical protein
MIEALPRFRTAILKCANVRISIQSNHSGGRPIRRRLARRAWALLSARRAKYARRAESARRCRSDSGSTPSGSTSRSNRASNARLAGRVAARRSGSCAQRVCAAMRERRTRSAGVSDPSMATSAGRYPRSLVTAARDRWFSETLDRRARPQAGPPKRSDAPRRPSLTRGLHATRHHLIVSLPLRPPTYRGALRSASPQGAGPVRSSLGPNASWHQEPQPELLELRSFVG